MCRMVLFAIIDKGILCKVAEVSGRKVVFLPEGYTPECDYVRVYKLRQIGIKE